LWYRVREDTLLWADFQVAMLPLINRGGTLLREGAAGAEGKTQRTCRNLVKLEAALWTFVWEAEVEPTNNSAERPLRRAVLGRRRSFGTQSGAGSQFVERILTAMTTLRQQRRDVLEYLTAACAAAICGAPAPSLLPSTQPTPSARIARYPTCAVTWRISSNDRRSNNKSGSHLLDILLIGVAAVLILVANSLSGVGAR
jgi:transposase